MTFSIVARCSKTSALGVAVATGVPSVGSRVPHVEAGVGAVATQGQTNVLYGVEGLKLLKTGIPPQIALDLLLSQDEERDKRQVIMIDSEGRIATFTGKDTVEWKGHYLGKDYAVAGNMLVGDQVLEGMTRTFEAEKGSLVERLLKALEAGFRAGGDKRGHVSAAIKVASGRLGGGPCVDVRVDEHSSPVARLIEVCRISRGYLQVSE